MRTSCQMHAVISGRIRYFKYSRQFKTCHQVSMKRPVHSSGHSTVNNKHSTVDSSRVTVPTHFIQLQPKLSDLFPRMYLPTMRSAVLTYQRRNKTTPPKKTKQKKTRPCTKQCRLVRGGTKKVTITCLYECTISRILEPVNIPRPISCYDEHEGGLAISFSGPARGNSVNQN